MKCNENVKQEKPLARNWKIVDYSKMSKQEKQP
jgi:hypothetical protein